MVNKDILVELFEFCVRVKQHKAESPFTIILLGSSALVLHGMRSNWVNGIICNDIDVIVPELSEEEKFSLASPRIDIGDKVKSIITDKELLEKITLVNQGEKVEIYLYGLSDLISFYHECIKVAPNKKEKFQHRQGQAAECLRFSSRKILPDVIEL